MIYKVDATFGVLVKIGERVKKGDKLGLSSNLKDIISEEEGIVKNIIFDGQEHIFIIEID
jgi:biotin carboxyl carrier protein